MRFVAALAICSILIGPSAVAQEEAAAAGETTTTPEAAAPAETGGETTELEATSGDAAPTEAETEEVVAETTSDEPATDEPSNMERIIVSGVAGAVAVAGLAVGITFGVLAQQEYACLENIVDCNKDRDEKIEGEDFLDARSEVERKALYADMGYLVAVTAATIAIVGAVELMFGGESEAVE